MAGYDEVAKQKARRAIREIARSQKVSEAEVRAEMEIAMMAGTIIPIPLYRLNGLRLPSEIASQRLRSSSHGA